MSTTITTTTSTEQGNRFHSVKPSFFGLVNGELFKIRRQWATWIMLIILIGLITLPFLVEFTLGGANLQARIDAGFLTGWVMDNLALFRAFSGFLLLILTARAIGQEYSQGTIRLLLARGVGRMQLLLAKLTAIAVWSIIFLVIDIALNFLYNLALLGIKVGNFNALNTLPADFWHNMGIYVLTILLNMLVTILLAAALSVIGRSLAFGMTASIAWFPIDNIGVAIMFLAFELTNNQFWLNITAYFLGPNLNTLAKAVLGTGSAIGSAPAVAVDGTHAIVVALVYAAIFAVVAFGLTWKRDVKE
jgi:ABC-2 type transport system permease protein